MGLLTDSEKATPKKRKRKPSASPEHFKKVMVMMTILKKKVMVRTTLLLARRHARANLFGSKLKKIRRRGQALLAVQQAPRWRAAAMQQHRLSEMDSWLA